MSVLIKRFRYILTSIVGLVMLAYSHYDYQESKVLGVSVVEMWSVDFYFLFGNGILGFLLLVTGSKHTDKVANAFIRLINALISRIERK